MGETELVELNIYLSGETLQNPTDEKREAIRWLESICVGIGHKLMNDFDEVTFFISRTDFAKYMLAGYNEVLQ